MDIKLSKRLQMVASFVPDHSYIVDVGCDHALLDIYLYKTLKDVKILATDIHSNPLKIAQENIRKYHLEEKIEVKLQDGIKDLNSSVDTIVIAGMGGILISKILSEKNALKKIKTIIVAPNNDFPLIRKTLVKNGFQITKEKLVIEKGITYLVIKAEHLKPKKISFFFGTLNNQELEVIYYYTKCLETNSNILKKLPKKYIVRRFTLKKENRKIRKFLEKK